MHCKWCAQPLRKLERPWNTKRGFYAEYANLFGFPWCPKREGYETGDLRPHEPQDTH